MTHPTPRASYEQIVDAIKVEYADESVEFATGVKALHENAQKRRIVFVWPGGSLKEAAGGGRLIEDGDRQIEAIYTNQAIVQAHIQGESIGQVEIMWAKLLIDTRACLGVYTQGGYEVKTEGDDAGYMHNNISAIVQEFTWDILILKADHKVSDGTLKTNADDDRDFPIACIIDNTLGD